MLIKYITLANDPLFSIDLNKEGWRRGGKQNNEIHLRIGCSLVLECPFIVQCIIGSIPLGGLIEPFLIPCSASQMGSEM